MSSEIKLTQNLEEDCDNDMSDPTDSNDSEQIERAILKQKNILVVGAGGIGCELLKNLVMSGFKKITIVDLDKVEKSNLNRQFLFNRDCIGKFKSEMAKESILKARAFDTELLLQSYIGNIKDKAKFDLEFFKSFDMILNALDNIDARTYINRICIQNSIPLVNSGTEGFLGNVAVHIRSLTPCYSCTPKQKKKAIPICSIRGKPEKIEHCVAWAKALWELLFAENTNGNLLEDYKIGDDFSLNFQNYFFYFILKESLTNNSNKDNNCIVPIDIQAIIEYDFEDINSNSASDTYHNFNNSLFKMDHSTSIDINFLVLILMKSTEKLRDSIKIKRFDGFDKENKEIVNFVYAASNLRATNFKIKNETRFKLKEIAGNIIPAIASTNAVIAALQTVESVKVLLKKNEYLRNISFNKDKKIASVKSQSDEKSDKCSVCSASALQKNLNTISIKINSNEFTLNDLVNVITSKANINDPQIYKNKSLVYESGQDLDEDELEYYEALLKKPMINFITNISKEFKISDLSEKKFLNLIVIHTEDFKNEQCEIKGELDIPDMEEEVMEEPENKPDENKTETENKMSVDDDGLLNEEECVITSSAENKKLLFISHKRNKSEISEDESEVSENKNGKKRKIENKEENILID